MDRKEFYVVQDGGVDNWGDSEPYTRFQDADDIAQGVGGVVIEVTFTYEDSELASDHRPRASVDDIIELVDDDTRLDMISQHAIKLLMESYGWRVRADDNGDPNHGCDLEYTAGPRGNESRRANTLYPSECLGALMEADLDFQPRSSFRTPKAALQLLVTAEAVDALLILRAMPADGHPYVRRVPWREPATIGLSAMVDRDSGYTIQEVRTGHRPCDKYSVVRLEIGGADAGLLSDVVEDDEFEGKAAIVHYAAMLAEAVCEQLNNEEW